MPLTVEDGSNVPGADAYWALADVDAYHSSRGNSSWTGADAIKEQAIRRATSYLDKKYRTRWIGRRRDGRAQPLEWPRADAWDTEGSLIASTEIPLELKYAMAEVSLRELVSPNSLQADYKPSQRVIRRQVGPIETEFEKGQSSSTVIPVVDDLVSTLLRDQGRSLTQFLQRA